MPLLDRYDWNRSPDNRQRRYPSCTLPASKVNPLMLTPELSATYNSTVPIPRMGN